MNTLGMFIYKLYIGDKLLSVLRYHNIVIVKVGFKNKDGWCMEAKTNIWQNCFKWVAVKIIEEPLLYAGA